MKEKFPIISVIVPIYNVKKYVEKCVQSICQQTLANIEIILIDDGSTDGSLDECRNIAKKDSRIQLIENNHQGVSIAKNRGLEIAKGKYVSFIDADDWIEKDMLQYLYERAEQYNADIVTCELSKDYPNGNSTREGSHVDKQAEWIEVINEINFNGEFTAYLVNKLFRRSLLQDICFRPGATIGEDYCFLMKVMLKQPTVSRGGACKYHYIQRGDSVSYIGYNDLKTSYRNRSNYKRTFEMLKRADSRLHEGALAYFVLQEMAVVISMVKANRYDRMMIKSVQREIRENVGTYLKINRVPFYLKGCAVLLSIHENLLIIPYKALFHKARSVDEQ